MTELRREFHQRGPIRRPPFALLSACLLALAPGLWGSAGEAGDVKPDGQPAVADTLEMREAAGVVLRDGPAPLLHPGDLDISSDGTVAVLDDRDYAVKLFAPDGSFLRTLGGRGTGRGQLAHPSAMTFVGDSLVAVADDQRLKLLLFGISGELQREVDLRIRPVNDLLFVDGRFVVGGLGPLVSSRDEVPYTIHHLGPDGTLLRSSFPVPPRFREPPALRSQRLALLAPKPDGGFYVTWRLADSIHAVDGGGHILRSRSLDASPYYRPGRQVAARAEAGRNGSVLTAASPIVRLLSAGDRVLIGSFAAFRTERGIRYRMLDERLRPLAADRPGPMLHAVRDDTLFGLSAVAGEPPSGLRLVKFTFSVPRASSRDRDSNPRIRFAGRLFPNER